MTAAGRSDAAGNPSIGGTFYGSATYCVPPKRHNFRDTNEAQSLRRRALRLGLRSAEPACASRILA